MLARVGVLRTLHGDITTPSFVAVGTHASVKALTPEQIRESGVQLLIGNTYHLYLEPGEEIVKEGGGLASFMNWDGPTMTDSGGFQVFSLGAAYNRTISKVVKGEEELLLPDRSDAEGCPRLVSIDADGVMFRSHKDGSAHYFTPEKSIEIQHALGADIIFAFDECISPTEPVMYQREALDRTHRWAKRSLAAHKKGNTQALFGIVQGGRSEELRRESAHTIGKMDFDGFGIGGSFAREDMETAVRWTNELLPPEKPRHLLGIGEPSDLFMGVENGVDLFDCVAPTRLARTGTLYTAHGKINIFNARYVRDFSPLDEDCACMVCKSYSRAYIAHLFRSREILGIVLATLHNVHFIAHLVARMRDSLLEGNFRGLRETFFEAYGI